LYQQQLLLQRQLLLQHYNTTTTITTAAKNITITLTTTKTATTNTDTTTTRAINTTPTYFQVSNSLDSIVEGLEAYNAVLALSKNQADQVIVLDNEAIYDICKKKIGATPTHDDLNRVISAAMSGKISTFSVLAGKMSTFLFQVPRAL